jgi:catechol 2,3-dioxygenase-like lactoylglutathione lyase family enzyme
MIYHSTVIFVKDIEVSKEFYTRYLGFSVEHDFGKNIILSNGLTLWEINPEYIISKQLETKIESNRYELYFEDDNIQEAFGKLERAGVKFFQTLHEEPWGQRTFRFFDPDKHLIEIGEPLPVFVRNMSAKGFSPEQIAAKSGIPPETVRTLIEK